MDADQTELLLPMGDAEGRNSSSSWVPAALRGRPTLEGITKLMDAFLIGLVCVSMGYSVYFLVAKESNSECKDTAAPMALEVAGLVFPMMMMLLVLWIASLVRERAAEWSTLLPIQMWFAAALLAWIALCVCGVPSEIVANTCGALLVVHVCVCLVRRSKIMSFIRNFNQDRLSPQHDDIGV